MLLSLGVPSLERNVSRASGHDNHSLHERSVVSTSRLSRMHAKSRRTV